MRHAPKTDGSTSLARARRTEATKPSPDRMSARANRTGGAGRDGDALVQMRSNDVATLWYRCSGAVCQLWFAREMMPFMTATSLMRMA